MLILFEELDIYKTEQFYKSILDELETIDDVFVLDFKNVQKIDLASIQLILSLKNFCDLKNIILNIKNINSRQIKQIFQLFNLKEKLGL